MPDSKKLESRISSYNLILRNLEEQKLAEKYPALIPVIASIRKHMDKVKGVYWQPMEPKSAFKKQMRRKLSQAAYHLSCGVYAYAQITGNKVLKNDVCYSFSDFYRPQEETTLGRCRQVLNAARKIKNPDHYGLTPEIINILEVELKHYNQFKNIPVQNVKEQAQQARMVKSQLDQCLTIIQKQLDPLMTIIQANEKLGVSYFIDRQLNNVPGRRRKYVRKEKTQKQQPLATSVILPLQKVKTLTSKISEVFLEDNNQ